MASNGNLTPAQARFAAALLTARNVTDAATKAGIPERTAHRWMADPTFRAQLAAKESEVWDDATRRLGALLSPALSVLGAVMADPNTPPGTRISAAGRIIDAALKLREQRTFEERLTALEQAGAL